MTSGLGAIIEYINSHHIGTVNGRVVLQGLLDTTSLKDRILIADALQRRILFLLAQGTADPCFDVIHGCLLVLSRLLLEKGMQTSLGRFLDSGIISIYALSTISLTTPHLVRTVTALRYYALLFALEWRRMAPQKCILSAHLHRALVNWMLMLIQTHPSSNNDEEYAEVSVVMHTHLWLLIRFVFRFVQCYPCLVPCWIMKVLLL
jgi:hypothetical protein